MALNAASSQGQEGVWGDSVELAAGEIGDQEGRPRTPAGGQGRRDTSPSWTPTYLATADKALAWPRFRCCRRGQQGNRRALRREGGRRAVHSKNGDGRASAVDASWEGRGASGLCRGTGCPANEALGRLWDVAVERRPRPLPWTSFMWPWGRHHEQDRRMSKWHILVVKETAGWLPVKIKHNY